MEELIAGLQSDGVIRFLPLKHKLRLLRVSKSFQAAIEGWFRRGHRRIIYREFVKSHDPMPYAANAKKLMEVLKMSPNLTSLVLESYIPFQHWVQLMQMESTLNAESLTISLYDQDMVTSFANHPCLDSAKWESITFMVRVAVELNNEALAALTVCPKLKRIAIVGCHGINACAIFKLFDSCPDLKSKVKELKGVIIVSPKSLKRLFQEFKNLDSIGIILNREQHNEEYRTILDEISSTYACSQVTEMGLESRVILNDAFMKGFLRKWPSIKTLSLDDWTYNKEWNMNVLLTSAPHLTKLRIPSIRVNSFVTPLSQNPSPIFKLEVIEAPMTSIRLSDLLWVMKHCPKLRVLRIVRLLSDEHSDLESLDLKIRELAPACQSIKKLTLLNQSTALPEIKQLVSLFRNLNSLHITFDNAYVDLKSAQLFVDTLFTCPRLRRIQVIYNIPDSENSENGLIIPKSIFNLKNLNELYLHGFTWGPDSESSDGSSQLFEDQSNPQFAKLLQHCPLLHPQYIFTIPPRVPC